MKKISKVLILLLIVFTFGACGKTTTTTSTTSSDNSKKITVTDGLGRKIELSKPAEKVLSNYAVATQILCTLGEQNNILGPDGKAIQNPLGYSPKTGASKSSATKGANELNVEQVVAAKPDLVVIQKKSKQIVPNLEKANIKVFVVNAEGLDELKSTVKNLGIATGKEKRADEFMDYYTQKLDFINNKIKTVDQKNKPKVYMAGGSMYLTPGKNMFQNSLIELGGGINVAGSLSSAKWNEVSAEQVIGWNPDIIILTQYCGVKPQDVLNNAGLKDINAVKNKKVYLMPSKMSSWDMPCPQTILGVMWLGTKTNPEVFKDTNITKEVDDFYQKFYGTTYTKLGGTLD
ncbi:ABC transporter substrate-binding protein [Clostridium sp. P21]|uniref:ABC transporter substrate-binding protein n=1 Tax=Clostridium muellerianum TaxID=2716538 RepID=A0A7Y0EIQ8_9CLOT|nr:ABC transporter substrate-binding protein [Clostridium muellerianum]NMM63130.1 ABC transporter substrate-binding protein [Clostridium muellerianum]